jgi:hypothetical protein
MSQHIIKAGAMIAVGGVTVGGSVLSIPLAPVYVVVGIIGGTIILKSYINNANKHKPSMANQKQTVDEALFTMEERGDSFATFKAINGKYVSRTHDNTLLKATAASVGKSELFRIMIEKDQIAMKDPITITKKITIEKNIEVNIDILDHKEAVKHKTGPFFGTLINWWSPEKAKAGVKIGVTKEIDENLKPRIEQQIEAELSARLCEEVTKKIIEELAKNKIKANVITEMK